MVVCLSVIASACAPSAGPVKPGADRYVALGSSFASGPGIASTLPDNPLCQRSDHNYAHLIAERLELNLVDATCSGATTENLSQPQGLNPPQLSAVTPDTALVTITIGGNDIDYTSTALTCLFAATLSLDCSVPNVATTVAAANVMRDALSSEIGAIRAVAPEAEILLVSYLQLFPDVNPSCGPSNPIGPTASAGLAQMGRILDDAFHEVAALTNVTLIDAYGASVNHTVCAAEADRWADGAVVTTGSVYHPNARGMDAIADLVVARVRSRVG